MLYLTLLRHAYSEIEIDCTDDFQRDISEKGKKEMEIIGKYLKEKKIVFDEILCSPSLRTKRTSDLILKFSRNLPSIKLIDDLYYNTTNGLLDIVMLEAKKKNVLVISHEPKLSVSISEISNELENNDYKRAVHDFSTSSLFQIKFSCKIWCEINKFNSKIIFFKKPTDLTS